MAQCMKTYVLIYEQNRDIFPLFRERVERAFDRAVFRFRVDDEEVLLGIRWIGYVLCAVSTVSLTYTVSCTASPGVADTSVESWMPSNTYTDACKQDSCDRVLQSSLAYAAAECLLASRRTSVLV